MYKEKIIHLFSIGAAIVILFSACRADVPSDNHQENTTNNNVSEKNNGIETNNDVSKSNIIETTIPPTITPTQALSDYNTLRGIQSNISYYDIEEAIVGFNSEGEIVVWAKTAREFLKNISIDIRNTPVYQYYQCYLANKIMDMISEIDILYLYDHDNIEFFTTKLTREKFTKLYDKELISDIEFFFSEEPDADNLVDYYRYYDNEPDTLWASTKPLERILALVFQDKLTDVKIDAAGCYDALSLNVYLDRNSLNKISNHDFAQMFIYSIGMYDPLYWNNFIIANVNNASDKESSWIFGMSDTDFEAWKNSGFKLSDWWKYCNYKNPEDQKLFSSNDSSDVQTTTEDQPDQVEASADLTYDEMMNTLKEIGDVNIISLGEGDIGYQAVLSFDCQTEEELFRRQYDALIVCMKLPIETLWFNSYVEGRTYISCMERERFNELNYTGDKFQEYFLPEDWPIFAGIYWAE